MTRHFLATTLTTALGLALATAGPAAAQSFGLGSSPAAYADDGYRSSYADSQRAAYDNGYRDGVKRGEQAARDRRQLDIERERDYRSADNGYNRSLGDRNRYRDNYRGGFAQGFRDGYSRRGAGGFPGNGRDYGQGPVYGGNGNYGRPGNYGGASYGAYQNGVSDGYRKGLDDVNDRKYADVNRQKWYRSGDHDYDSRYGSKDAYRVDYRRGFEEGYTRAFRERRGR